MEKVGRDATKGPWEVDSVSEVTSSDGDIWWQMSMLNAENNSAFIATARNNWDKLVEMNKALLGALEWYEDDGGNSKMGDIARAAIDKCEKIVGEK